MRRNYFKCYQNALKSLSSLKEKIQNLQRVIAYLELHFVEFGLFRVTLRLTSRRSFWVERNLLCRRLWEPYYSTLRGVWCLSMLALPFKDVAECQQRIYFLNQEVEDLYDKIGGEHRKSLLVSVCKILHDEVSSLLDQSSHLQTQALALVELHLNSIQEKDRAFLRNFLFVPPGQEIFEIIDYRGLELPREVILALRILISHQGELEGREFLLVHPEAEASTEEKISFVLQILHLKEEVEQLHKDWTSLIYCNNGAQEDIS